MLISIALNTMSGKFALVINTNMYVYIRMLCVNELCVCVCMRACVRACVCDGVFTVHEMGITLSHIQASTHVYDIHTQKHVCLTQHT